MTTEVNEEKISNAEGQHAVLGLSLDNVAVPTRHPEAQWFPEAGLGLFLTWGIASIHGNLELSWGMIANTTWDAAGAPGNKVTPEEYWKLAGRFDPQHYDPDKWIKAAAAAGFQYAVLVVMHHDGYTLWPSKYSGIGTHTHLGGRDLVRPYVEACRKHGLKVGLYLSPPDWHAEREYRGFGFCPESSMNGDLNAEFGLNARHEQVRLKKRTPELAARLRENWHGRTMELLTRYGRIDLLWFDGGGFDNELRDKARAVQPHIVINNRACIGDYNDTECKLPKERPRSEWFEACHCWQACDIPMTNGGFVDVWGYLATEKFKSAAWMLEHLCKLRAWGGNLLINIGPGPDGDLPQSAYERLSEVADWMAHSKESVIGADGEPEPNPANVPMTVRGRSRYLHLIPGSGGAIRVDSSIPAPASARLLRTGGSLSIVQDSAGFTIVVPDDLRTGLVDVVVIE